MTIFGCVARVPSAVAYAVGLESLLSLLRNWPVRYSQQSWPNGFGRRENPWQIGQPRTAWVRKSVGLAAFTIDGEFVSPTIVTGVGVGAQPGGRGI